MTKASQTISDFLKHHRIRSGAVAVSGGADSLCLLLLLKEAGLKLSALHCHHGLRGSDADKDLKKVREVCKRLGVPLKVFRKKVAKGPGLEERARIWRRACYAKAEAPYVFLGHHALDQAETLLMNLARGAGLKGAGGMRELAPLESSKSVKLARPFLETAPEELKAELRQRGLAWREDKSNQSGLSKRNLIRAKVLPQLEELLPGAVTRMAAFARRARAEEEALSSLAKAALSKAKVKGGWLLARMLLLASQGLASDEAAVQRALQLVKKGSGKADLKKKARFEAGRGRLKLRK